MKDANQEARHNGSALEGQTVMNLFPTRRVVKLIGFGLLAALLLFLTVMMLTVPENGVPLTRSSEEAAPAQSQITTEAHGQASSDTLSAADSQTPNTSQNTVDVFSPADRIPEVSGDTDDQETYPLLMGTYQSMIACVKAASTLPPPDERVPIQSVTLLALGDNLMHNTVMWSGETAYGYDFRPMYQYIKEDVQAADIACINQETIFINDPTQFTNYPSFGGPVQIGDALIDTGFDVIEHATNHCYDKFDTGILDTLAFWHQHPEISVLGIHDSQADADTIRVREVNGIRIAFLNYTYGTNSGYPSASYMIDYLGDRDQIAADIAAAKEISDFVIVFPHWGTENTFHPDESQREWAQFFCDQGVGAVIGCHTHTLQPMEIYTREDGSQMPVFWSLGNFISHMSLAQNMLGGMARLTISRDTYGVYVSECSLEPTVTYGTHDFGVWQFYGMKLSDYTSDMAAHHLIDGTSPEELEALYQTIISDD